MRELGTTVTLLTEKQVDDLIADYNAGMRVREIAEKFGVARWTVTNHVVRRNVPFRTRGIDPDLVPDLIASYKDGHTLAEIAATFGLAKGTIRNALLRAGTTLRAAAPRIERSEQHGEVTSSTPFLTDSAPPQFVVGTDPRI